MEMYYVSKPSGDGYSAKSRKYLNRKEKKKKYLNSRYFVKRKRDKKSRECGGDSDLHGSFFKIYESATPFFLTAQNVRTIRNPKKKGKKK